MQSYENKQILQYCGKKKKPKEQKEDKILQQEELCRPLHLCLLNCFSGFVLFVVVVVVVYLFVCLFY